MIVAFEQSAYLPILLILMMAITFALVNVIGSMLLGPRRDGGIKTRTYESGMEPIGSARKRFNVRFYILAMTFLVFDVEIVFLYPWAVSFTQIDTGSSDGALFLGRALFFLLTTVIAYIYAWRKGVFSFD